MGLQVNVAMVRDPTDHALRIWLKIAMAPVVCHAVIGLLILCVGILLKGHITVVSVLLIIIGTIILVNLILYIHTIYWFNTNNNGPYQVLPPAPAPAPAPVPAQPSPSSQAPPSSSSHEISVETV